MAGAGERPPSLHWVIHPMLLAFSVVAAVVLKVAAHADAAFPLNDVMRRENALWGLQLAGSSGTQMQQGIPTLPPSKAHELHGAPFLGQAPTEPYHATGVLPSFGVPLHPKATLNSSPSGLPEMAPPALPYVQQPPFMFVAHKTPPALPNVQEPPPLERKGPIALSTFRDGRAGVVSSVFGGAAVSPGIYQQADPPNQSQAAAEEPNEGRTPIYVARSSEASVPSGRAGFRRAKEMRALEEATHSQQFSAWGKAQPHNVLLVTVADATLFQGRKFWFADEHTEHL